VWPSARELLFQLSRLDSWSYLAVFALAGVACALALGRFRLAAFAALWLALSFGGLVAIYWISTNPLANHLFNSADRTIVTLVLGTALLVPVLLQGDSEPGEL
jgi:hypothetical protein